MVESKRMKKFGYLRFFLALFFSLPSHASVLDRDRAVLGDEVVAAVRKIAATVAEEKRAADFYLLCQGRLTLTSGVPVTTSDVTSATTVYFTPFNGNRIGLSNGSKWWPIVFTEASVAVPATTNTPFDIFGYNSGSGLLSLETHNWTNDTTRATALALQDGIYVKSGDITRRYLGTARTTSVSGQTEDSAAQRYLINYYNTRERTLFIAPAYSDGNNQTTYTTTSTSWVEANSGTDSRVGFIIPEQGWSVHITLMAHVFNSSSSNVVCAGIGIDSTSTAKAETLSGVVYADNYHSGSVPWDDHSLGVGGHYIAILITTSAGTLSAAADDVRSGGSSDPYMTYLSGWILG